MTDRPLPGWPRGMSIELAAGYLSLSASILDREAKAGRAPQPLYPTPGRKIWLKEDLDAYLTRLAGRQQAGTDRPAPSAAGEWDAMLGGTGGA